MGLPENTALLLNSINKKSDNKNLACDSNAPSHSFYETMQMFIRSKCDF